MKNLFNTLAFILCTITFGQNIQNAKTVTVEIDGNCGMCEKTIENAATQEGISSLDWDKSTKKAILTYDANKTSPKQVLKKVAEAGYDNQFYKADESTYNSLPGCCQYTRSEVTNSKKMAKVSCGEKDGKKACCSEKSDKKACDSKNGVKTCDTKKEKKDCCTNKTAKSTKAGVKTKKACGDKADKSCCADKKVATTQE